MAHFLKNDCLGNYSQHLILPTNEHVQQDLQKEDSFYDYHHKARFANDTRGYTL